jgi:hypothetical protein
MPARDFETSRRFYEELGFRSEPLSECLVEMRLGGFSFILQDYYVAQWADNFVFHMRVTDVHRWWDRMVSLNLADRFGVRATAPHAESRGLVADTIDPSGVLWRIAAPQASTVLAEPERAHC